MISETISLAKDKGASNWLVVLPLEEEGFALNNEEFWDALYLRYDFPLQNLPSKCPCNKSINVPHAMTCKRRFQTYTTQQFEKL